MLLPGLIKLLRSLAWEVTLVRDQLRTLLVDELPVRKKRQASSIPSKTLLKSDVWSRRLGFPAWSLRSTVVGYEAGCRDADIASEGWQRTVKAWQRSW